MLASLLSVCLCCTGVSQLRVYYVLCFCVRGSSDPVIESDRFICIDIYSGYYPTTELLLISFPEDLKLFHLLEEESVHFLGHMSNCLSEYWTHCIKMGSH